MAGIAATVGIAVVAVRCIYRPSFVNYDAQWALLWARDAWSGFLPEYTADFAPTPHPLATAVSSLALPFGGEADIAILWLTLLSFGALVYLTYRLGAELFNPWVGAVAALVVLTRPVLLRDTLIGYQDLPFAALVVGAVLLEARRHRRGVAGARRCSRSPGCCAPRRGCCRASTGSTCGRRRRPASACAPPRWPSRRR